MHISFTTTHCDGISAPIAAGLIPFSILCFIGSTTRVICAMRGWSLNQRRFLTRRGMQANSRQMTMGPESPTLLHLGKILDSYRNSLVVTLSVWKALLLREALARLFSGRASWFWLIAEPILHMAMFGYIYAGIRQRTIGGIDNLIWLVLGLQGFFLFRRTDSQMAGAIDSNRECFSNRQVKPTDRSEEHTSELQSLMRLSYVVF